MAPDIPKIDPDRHPNLGDAAWNFGDEVLRWFFHGHSLSDSKDLLIPFFGKFKFVEFRRGEVADNPVFRELRNAICTRCRLYGQMEKFRFADDPEVNDQKSDRSSHDHRFAGNLERSAIQNVRLRLLEANSVIQGIMNPLLAP
jgi:hypothetical protein